MYQQIPPPGKIEVIRLIPNLASNGYVNAIELLGLGHGKTGHRLNLPTIAEDTTQFIDGLHVKHEIPAEGGLGAQIG